MPLTDLKQAQSLTQYLTLAQFSKYFFFTMALVVIPTYFLTRVIFGKTFGRGKNLYIPSGGAEVEFLDEDNLYRPVLADPSFTYV